MKLIRRNFLNIYKQLNSTSEIRHICLCNLKYAPIQIVRNLSSKNSTLAAREKWQLFSAVCLERFPRLTQQLNDIEKRYMTLLEKIEFENSLLSDHEMKHAEDLKASKKLGDEAEGEVMGKTAAELEDSWEAELLAFNSASRLTEADEKNDVKSPDRLLDKKLILLVKQSLGDQMHWVMPQGARKENESMRQCAERTLSELCGNTFTAAFMGNAPCGFLKYRYSSKKTEEFVGAKVFFFKAQLLSGSVKPSSALIGDYKWTTKDELSTLVTPNYFNHTSRFILEL